MSFDVRATAPEETERVRAFLAGVFGATLDAPFLEPACVRWRFHDPHPNWKGSRSYVFERNGDYVAHGCVWPMPLVTADGVVTACQIIDWAGSRAFPGSGLLLRRKIEELVAVSAGIGGSEDSRRVMPKSGYATVAQFRRFVRVVRPFRQMVQRQDGEMWQRAAKAVRNISWSAAPTPKVPAGWSVERAEQPSAGGLTFETRGRDFIPTMRSAELLSYLMRCPAARVSVWMLKRDSAFAGYFLLSEVHGQTRLADLQMVGSQQTDWLAGVAAVTETAAQIPETCEIIADSSMDLFSNALAEAGYRARGEQPVFIRDLQQRLHGRQLHITDVDYDAFFAWYPGGHFSA